MKQYLLGRPQEGFYVADTFLSKEYLGRKQTLGILKIHLIKITPYIQQLHSFCSVSGFRYG